MDQHFGGQDFPLTAAPDWLGYVETDLIVQCAVSDIYQHSGMKFESITWTADMRNLALTPLSIFAATKS